MIKKQPQICTKRVKWQSFNGLRETSIFLLKKNVGLEKEEEKEMT